MHGKSKISFLVGKTLAYDLWVDIGVSGHCSSETKEFWKRKASAEQIIAGCGGMHELIQKRFWMPPDCHGRSWPPKPWSCGWPTAGVPYAACCNMDPKSKMSCDMQIIISTYHSNPADEWSQFLIAWHKKLAANHFRNNANTTVHGQQPLIPNHWRKGHGLRCWWVRQEFAFVTWQLTTECQIKPAKWKVSSDGSKTTWQRAPEPGQWHERLPRRIIRLPKKKMLPVCTCIKASRSLRNSATKQRKFLPNVRRKDHPRIKPSQFASPICLTICCKPGLFCSITCRNKSWAPAPLKQGPPEQD